VPLIVEYEQGPQRVQNPTFLEIVIDPEISLQHIADSPMIKLLVLQSNTAIECPIQNLIDKFLIIDQNLVVDADLIKKGSGSYPLGEVGQDVGDVVHEEMLGLGVVEAEEGEVLEDREEQPAVDLRDLLVAHDVNVVDQRLVNALGHVQLLEEKVILLLLSVEVIDDRYVEHLLLDEHQRLDVL
jgi:hypothetical protein